MNTRTISYINPDEDLLEIEVDLAVNRSMEQNFLVYCEHIVANYAMAGIDVVNYSISKEIYYIDEN